MSKRKPYPSDLSDDEWRLLEPFLPTPAKEGRPSKYDLRGGKRTGRLPLRESGLPVQRRKEWIVAAALGSS